MNSSPASNVPRPSDPGPRLDLAQTFPGLEGEGGQRSIYLDSAATTQKPQCVLDAITDYYLHRCANVHRAAHRLGIRATEAFEGARQVLARFVGAEHPDEVVFVRGATEGINLVAFAHAAPRLRPGDEVLVTHLEHHSNLVPWQMVCSRTGATLRAAPINQDGDLDVPAFEELLSERTRFVAFTWVANATGAVLPVATLVRLAHGFGACVLVDATQAAPHLTVDAMALDADFLVMSGHKCYGPTGAGLVYGRRALWQATQPFMGGGEMIRSVTIQHTRYAEPPHRFEAGTPDIAAVLGLGAAAQWLAGLDPAQVAAHEAGLLSRLLAGLATVRGLRLVGNPKERIGIVSFNLDGFDPHEVAAVLDAAGVMVRAGHHCAQPLMDSLGVPACVRISLALSNVEQDVDAAVLALLELAGPA